MPGKSGTLRLKCGDADGNVLRNRISWVALTMSAASART